MGAQLVTLALARWAPHISDRAFRVLIRMAVTALDNDNGTQPAAMYFGGPELLALTLRPHRGGTDETASRTVRRALSELVTAGAIECIEKPRKGKRGVYRLRLNAGLQSPPFRTPESAVDGDSGLQSPNFGPLVSPLGEGSQQAEERLEEEGVGLPAQVQTAREDTAENPISIDVEGDASEAPACSACGALLDPYADACFRCHRKVVSHAS